MTTIRSFGATLDSLVEQSASLLPNKGDAVGFPTLHRNVEQLEEHSRQLQAKSSRMEASSESNAATRLLAQQGFNMDRLSRDMRTFEMQTTFDDVFPVEGTTVEEYLDQVHSMTLLSAIEKEHQNAVDDFQNFMLACADADWEKRRHGYSFGGNAAASAMFHAAEPTAMHTTPTPRTPGTKVFGSSSKVTAFTPGGAPPPSPFARLGGERPEAYFKVVRSMNDARLQGARFDAAKAFADAAAATGAAAGADLQTSVGSLWLLLSSMLANESGGEATPGSLVRGARKHLEAGHAAYMLDVIRKHAQVARLGGETSPLARVRAFLRVHLQGQGPLDFDAEGSAGAINTTWRQVYYCIRSGYLQEALQVVDASTDPSGRQTSIPFADALREWVRTDGAVSKATASALSQQCKRMLAAGQGPRAEDHNCVHLLVLYALVSGDPARTKELIVQNPGFFSYIQDFMWFQLAIVRDEQVMDSPSVAVAAPFRVQDLQSFLRQYPSKHYSRDGHEPLAYVNVLLLSLQFKSAIQYLLSDPATHQYRTDAVHMAMALAHHDVLEMEEAHAELASLDVPARIAQYGEAVGNPAEALEYLAFATQVAPKTGSRNPSFDDPMALFRQLLQEQNAVNQLLGEQGGVSSSQTPLARFVPDVQRRKALLAGAGDECSRNAKYDEAVELYARAGEYAKALEIVNHLLGNQLGEPSPAPPTTNPRIKKLLAQGERVKQMTQNAAEGPVVGGVNLRTQEDDFAALNLLTRLFTASAEGNNAEVIRCLRELPYIPMDRQRVRACQDDFKTRCASASALTKSVPRLILVAATALHAALKEAEQKERALGVRTNVNLHKEQLKAVTDFGANIPMPAEMHRRLATICTN
mmetsp:Transcript_31486/g.59180  ORF Transcript_31486/g.59180 Transcript_31486/m.59180 type:complete len:867 (-) Transcript_31486:321-2921(-)